MRIALAANEFPTSQLDSVRAMRAPWMMTPTIYTRREPAAHSSENEMGSAPGTRLTHSPSCWLAGPKCPATPFKLKFLLSFAAFLGFYWAAFGLKPGIRLRRPHSASRNGPTSSTSSAAACPRKCLLFLPGFGAYVRWAALGVSLGNQSRDQPGRAKLAEAFWPQSGCVVLWRQTGSPLWAALARAGAVLESAEPDSGLGTRRRASWRSRSAKRNGLFCSPHASPCG